MTSVEQDKLCFKEKEAVKSFLVSNQIGFANLIQERLAIINQQ